MDYGTKGKTALVLGGGGGIGRAIAAALANEGARIALADVDALALQQSASELTSMGAEVLPLMWDLKNLEEIDSHVTNIERHLGSVDILVNNTGGPPPSPALGQDAALWLTHFQSMVVSVIKITDRVIPGMKDRQWGRVITSTSSGVVAPIPNLAISNALRMSLVGWSKTLAREVGRNGIAVNIVLPGRIATDRIKFLDEAKAAREGRLVEDAVSESTSSIPVGRYGTPSEYGNVVAFLASMHASYITGSMLRVDGGLIPTP